MADLPRVSRPSTPGNRTPYAVEPTFSTVTVTRVAGMWVPVSVRSAMARLEWYRPREALLLWFPRPLLLYP